MMRFEWDEATNAANIRKHGIDFSDAIEVFDHPMLTMIDDREDYGEERWLGVGLMQGRTIVVIYVERDGDRIRRISARKATKHEVRRYEQRR